MHWGMPRAHQSWRVGNQPRQLERPNCTPGDSQKGAAAVFLICKCEERMSRAEQERKFVFDGDRKKVGINAVRTREKIADHDIIE